MNIAIGGIDTTGTVQNVQAQSSEQKEMQEKTQEKTVNQPERSYDAVSLQGDTLTISEAGKSAASRNQSESDGVVVKQPAPETEDSSVEKSTVNLSSYTETELKQMYLDGEITRQEYEDELSSRQTNG